jgi:hypothetical protein
MDGELDDILLVQSIADTHADGVVMVQVHALLRRQDI